MDVEMLADELDKAKARIRRLEDVVETLAMQMHSAGMGGGHAGEFEQCYAMECRCTRALTEEPR